MQRDHRFVTYVTPLIADWVSAQARERRVSASIVIGDCIFDAWNRDTEANLKTPATDPVRQNVFISVALDALLANHRDPELRDRTVAVYRHRLERLGLAAPRPQGGSDEA